MSEFSCPVERRLFRERMELAYNDALGVDDYQVVGGAQTWYARRSGIDKAQVSRMLSGELPIYGYAEGALRLLEEINDLRARALHAEENLSIALLQDAAQKAREEADRLDEKIQMLQELCERPEVNGDKVLGEAMRGSPYQRNGGG